MTNTLHTSICDLLDCTYPILQSGMGGVARSELAAAVSAAGGFGCLGMVRESPALIEREIAAIRAVTAKPFGVNLIPSATDAQLFNDELAVCIDAGVSAVVYFWDVVPEAVEKAKVNGLRVLYQVGSIAEAQAAEAAGADAIIAQGMEAGGHVRGSVSSLVLLPQVVKAVNVPVIGAGGFASGASLIAAFALGAQGIQCGTAFVASTESIAHDVHKQKVVAAGSEQTVHTDAYVINWPKGSPVRVLANADTDSLGERLFGYDPAHIERVQIAEEEGRPIYLWSTDSPSRYMKGDLERLALYAGQVTGQVKRVSAAHRLVEEIVQEAKAVQEKLQCP